jgi:hypothetical protein
MSNKTRHQDIVKWHYVPVKALDEHPLWKELALLKSVTSSGKEIRVYVNSSAPEVMSRCSLGLNLSALCAIKNHPCTKKTGLIPEKELNDFLTCSDAKAAGCNNVFYIEDGIVSRYIPVGNCTTNEQTIPDKKYLRP